MEKKVESCRYRLSSRMWGVDFFFCFFTTVFLPPVFSAIHSETNDTMEALATTTDPKPEMETPDVKKRKRRERKRKRSDQDRDDCTKRARNGELHETEKTKATRASKKAHGAAWNISRPMGGRMADIDPIFSQDEELAVLNGWMPETTNLTSLGFSS